MNRLKMNIFYTNPGSNKKLDYGTKGLEITQEWDKKFIRVIEKESIDTLHLNFSRGWKTSSYSFLEELPKLKSLVVLDVNGVGLESVNSLTDLESISISGPISPDIDFSRFAKLKRCFLSWKKEYKSIYKAPNLDYLYLDEFKEGDKHELGKLNSLKTLKLGNSTISNIKFLEEFDDLKWVELLNCRKITDIQPISKLSSIERLFIRGSSKLTDVTPLKYLALLEVLVLEIGEIESLSFLKNLNNLKAFSYRGRHSNIIDGDLSVLAELPKLSMVGFIPKKHYSHEIIKQWNWDNFDTPDILLKEK